MRIALCLLTEWGTQMSKKPSYEALAQRIRDLGQKAVQGDEEEKDANERYIALFD